MNVKELMEQRERHLTSLRDRWNFLTDHLKDDRIKQGLVAQLLENQSADKIPLFDTDQVTTNLPTSVFPKSIALPVIVQTFPALVANEIVQVQPMRTPNGLVPYMRTIRSSNGDILNQQGSWTYTEETAQPPKARMRFDMLELAAEKFMLNLEWSAEVEEDASALAGIDFQAEMIRAVREELQGEIDYMVIRDLFTAASMAQELGTAGMVTNRAGAGNVNFDWDTPTGANETTKSHQELLLNSLVDLKAQIYNASNRIPNFIVGGSLAVARLEKLDSFAPDKRSTIGINGSAKVGTLQGQYDVYVSAAAPSAKLLMGVKRTGYVLGIYRPLELTPITYQNESDEYIRGVRTRVARRIVDAANYGTLTFV